MSRQRRLVRESRALHWAAGSDGNELRYHPAGSAEGGIIQPGKIVLDRPRGVGGNVLDAPLLSRHRALLVGIGLNQAGINGKPFATHQAFGHALAHHKERSSSEPPLLGIEAVETRVVLEQGVGGERAQATRLLEEKPA